MLEENVRRVEVGPAAEFPPGTRRIIVPFRGRAGIGVFNVNGTYHALRNLCPHKSGPLCTGRVSGRVVADAPPTVDDANLDLVREGEIIRCPWHLWEFEIATGRCLVDPHVRVKTYPVVVEDGLIVVYADPADLPPNDTPG
jgi:nitrite reductase/ring-hydroxylating ferredoxin subunit